MVTRITRWSPDTCDCIFEYEWDDSVPQDQMTVTPTQSIRKCQFHSSLASDTEVFNVLQDENPKKNRAWRHIVDNIPTQYIDTNPDGTKVLKSGVGISYSYSGTAPNRILTLNITGVTLTPTQKNSLQNFINTKFPVGQVIVING